MSFSSQSVVFLLAGMLLAPVGAAALDLHRLWEDRCGECHGHAGDFARQHLSVVQGRLQGLHPERDLRRFLTHHYLAGHEVDAVHDMLLAQTAGEARFREKCGACHGSAAQLARDGLELRDDELYGRKSGRLIAEFMQQHGQLTAEEVPFFVQLLRRVEREVHGP